MSCIKLNLFCIILFAKTLQNILPCVMFGGVNSLLLSSSLAHCDNKESAVCSSLQAQIFLDVWDWQSELIVDVCMLQLT